MIELIDDNLYFSFPKIKNTLHALAQKHLKKYLPRILEENQQQGELGQKATDPVDVEMLMHLKVSTVLRQIAGNATLNISFKRTLRIPDDGKTYPLPASLGEFPLRHIDDVAHNVPADWLRRGGVLMPMYQAEALWLRFQSDYPFALKIGAGKINAVTGATWANGLHHDPQDFVSVPNQPWLDGFAVEKGVIRQFVAMGLGHGFTAEEQLSGKAEFGGIQLQVYPLKPEVFFKKSIQHKLPTRLEDIIERVTAPRQRGMVCCSCAPAVKESSMGLGAGGKMVQEIYADTNNPDDWATTVTSRCFVHLCNALQWKAITGTNPPHEPISAKKYAMYGIPWFDHYRDDLKALDGADALAGLKTVSQVMNQLGGDLADNAPVPITAPVVATTTTPRDQLVKEWSD